MRLLIDNALSPIVADRLRQGGHDVVHVRDLGLASAPVMDAAAVDSRVLVSADTDFGTLLARRGAAHPSIVLLRRSSQCCPEVQAALLLANLPTVEDALTSGAVVVLEDNRLAFGPCRLGPATEQVAPLRRRAEGAILRVPNGIRT